MWYTGFEGGGGSDGPNLKLGYATSSDGLQWTRYPGNPIYDKSWIEDMMVVKRDDTYYMFAEGKHDIAQLLTSADGIHWTLIGPLDIRLTNGQPISAGPRGTPTAYFENGTWYLFYERRDLGIWLATSKDTKVWRNVDDEPVLKLGPHKYDDRQVAMNQIVKHDGYYYAYYHGSGHEQPRLWCTDVAVSKDLIHWTKYRDNPLLPIEDNKSSGILVHDGKRFGSSPCTIRSRSIFRPTVQIRLIWAKAISIRMWPTQIHYVLSRLVSWTSMSKRLPWTGLGSRNYFSPTTPLLRPSRSQPRRCEGRFASRLGTRRPASDRRHPPRSSRSVKTLLGLITGR